MRDGQGGAGHFVTAWWDGTRVAAIGGVMSIVKILKEQEDGKLDLVARCEERCRIVEFTEEASYQIARTNRITDMQTDWSEPLATRAFKLHRKLLRIVIGEIPDESFYCGLAALSFRILPSSGLPAEVKQQIIEMTDENERLEFVCDHLEQQIRGMAEVLGKIAEIHSAWHMRSLSDR